MKRLISPKYLIFLALAALTLSSVFYFSNSVGAQNKVVRAGEPVDQSYDTTKGDSPRYPAEEEPEIEKSMFQELIDWWNGTDEKEREESEEADADLPSVARGKISKAEYMKLRGEYIGRLRGIEPDLPFDPTARSRAVNQLQQQELNLQSKQSNSLAPTVAWTEIGPFSLPNGQTQTGAVTAVNGRVTAIAVDPTDSNIVYLGTAQGGVWRSNNGGTTWTSIFDNAQTLVIGALAIAPTNHSILYIGTGEPNLCGDCFFGIGVYRIDNADTTTGAVGDLKGPINPTMTYNTSTGGTIVTTAFAGRSISQIAVSPTDPATIYVGTSTGASGSGGSGLSGFVPPVGLVGLYRSTNGTAAPGSVAFTKIGVSTADGTLLDFPNTGSRRISDVAFEPGNPNNLLVSTFGLAAANDGGIFRSTNAASASPTFTQTYTVQAQRIRFAVQKTGAVVTVLAATDETPPTGASCAASTSQLGIVRRSIDGGVTFPTTLAGSAAAGGVIPTSGGYCGGQCFYNVTIAVNPTNANDMYLGGNARSTCSDAMKHSTNGLTFARDDTSVHADSHALAFSADGNFIYYGNDGGVWKRSAQSAGVPTPAGTAWTDLNSNPLNMFQFVSLAVHPTDRNFTIGGTQDNGTESQTGSSGNWTSAVGGDGGYTLIDQSATDTTNVTMYHTYFNQPSSLIGFERTNLGNCLSIKGSWEGRGFGFGSSAVPACDGTASAATNGLTGTDNVLFYAPMALGPGTPNTLYFGTTRLYRSVNKGDTMTLASQTLSGTATAGSPISTIGISPQNDNLRLVGLQNGQVWGTSTGSSTLVNITSASFPANPTGSTTNKFVGRAQITPTNPDVAYVTFSFYAPAGQGIWKISNFQAATSATPVAPVWTAVSSGIPSVPINAFVVDPQNANYLYAGTDIGVYFSTDAGASWNPFGTGLPRVSVFDLAIQPTNRLLRAATHGRGMFEIAIPYAPTAASASISGRALTAGGKAISVALISITDSRGKTRTTTTNPFGYYNFNDVAAGQTYVVSASAKGYRFNQPSQIVNLTDDVGGLNFIGN